MNKKCLLTLSIVFGLWTIVFPQTDKRDKQLIKEIENYLSRQFKNNEPGCAVIVVRRGQVLYEKGLGLADIELNVSNQAITVFRLGSITKQFTAIAILQLAEQGKLSLTDSVQKFVPDFPFKGYEITIEHLLTHTSGIKEYLSMSHSDPFVLRRDFRPKELIDFFKNEPLEFKPGTKWSYSNSGYYLLGYIIEQASGKTYGQFINDNIFQPSGMTASFYGNYSGIIPNRASGYKMEENKYQNCDYQSMTIAYSAGALLSNVVDMYKWHQALYSNKIVKKETREKALSSFKLLDGLNSNYGYGWFINAIQVQGSPTITHTGGIKGFSTIEMYLPNEDVFVTVLSNLENNPKVQESAVYIAALAIGKKMNDEIAVDRATIESYKGKYEMTSQASRIALIKEMDGKLIIEVVGEWKAQLLAITPTTFNIKNVRPAMTLEFVKNETGKLTKFTINQGGLTDWKKIE